MSQDPRQNSVGAAPQFSTPQYNNNTYLPYSQNAPSYRAEYAPSPPPVGQPYLPPPPTQSVGRGQGRRYADEDSDDDGYSSDRRSHRPLAIARRSSSYHGPRGNDDYYNERQLVQTRRRGSHDGSDMTRSRELGEGHHNFKDGVGKHFTKSPVGITGAVGGALVGGWVAKNVQVAAGRKDGKHHGSNPLLTLLGAAAGGLVVNAVIDKFEDRKKENAEKEEAWEEKYGHEDEEEDGRGRRDRSRGSHGSHGSHGGHKRHRSRSYSNDRYD